MPASRHAFGRLLRRLRRLLRNDLLLLSLLAMVVGAVTGSAVIGLREAIDFAQVVFYGISDERFADQAAELPGWRIILATTFGGLLVGLFIRYVLPGGRPHSVADVIEASTLKRGQMSLTTGLAAALASILSLGAGASVGREGPAIHLGASLSGWFGARLGLNRGLNQTLLGCGVAAAVAASFNAPLAGALFANEVVIGHYAIKAFAPVVLASVAGTAVTRTYFGDLPAFAIVDHPIKSFWEFPAFVGLGITSAIAAIILMEATLRSARLAQRAPVPTWARPAVAGFGLGVLALFVPNVLGVGYGTLEDSVLLAIPFWMLFVILIAKVAATALSLGWGFNGGIFSPALVVGALVGSIYGTLATAVFPEYSSGVPAYAIVGMGAVAAAVLGAPISTTLIIFELTSDYTLTIAVMLAVVIASEITHQVYGRSYFTLQLKGRGVDLSQGLEQDIMQTIRIWQVLGRRCEVVDPGYALADLRSALQKSDLGQAFVVKSSGELMGTVTLADLSEFAFERDLDVLINAGDVARLNPPVVARGDDLQTAAELMRETGEYVIAVVDDRESMTFAGAIRYRDIMHAYSEGLLKARQEEHGL